ncbi:MAG TPA: hypothetical protein VNQ90_16205 [Chthoniobacteraceae bacterium]|nr:hypothetical protein [Chthoniobacteraceae bacterium]
MNPDRPPDRAAFTLVELAIVIGLAAILALLLLPLLGSARDRANATTCVSQVRSIVIAILQHAADHDGRLISAWETPYTEESYWANRLGPYLGHADPKERLGRDYLQCPTQRAARAARGEAMPYGTYGVVYTGGPGSAPKPLFGMRKDSGRLANFRPNTMLVGDALGLIYSPSVWRLDNEDKTSSKKHAAPYNQAAFPHNDGMVSGFVDGSVRLMTLEEWKNGAAELKLQ